MKRGGDSGGVTVDGWGEKQRTGLDRVLAQILRYPYDYELARVWAKVSAHCKRNGRRFEAGDAWIAATAVHRGIPLLTHDADHVGLKMAGLEIVSSLDDAR